MESTRWGVAAEKWYEEKVAEGNKDLRNPRAKLDWLEPQLRGKTLDEVDRDLVRKIVEVKQTGATRNRHVALIAAVLRSAVGRGELSRLPVLMKYEEPKRRIRYLKREQVARLVELLEELPPHQKDMFLFGLATGLRQGKVKALEWDWVDLDERLVYVPDQKNGESLTVPLNDLALAILERWVGKDRSFVFVYRGKPLRNVNTRGWQQKRRAAGLHQFRWHDATRHTWASWLAQNGTNSFELQEMGGWKSPTMVRRYAALAPNHLRKHAAKIDFVLDSES